MYMVEKIQSEGHIETGYKILPSENFLPFELG